MPELTILIVSHNTARDLDSCLQSLHRAPPRLAHEIFVIDNASRDGTAEAVRSTWPQVRVIALDANVGFARANNVGFRESQSELVLLLNSDTSVPPEAIDELVRQIRELPGASVVGPKLINAEGAAELSFGRMMTPWAELRQKLLPRMAGSQGIERMASRPQVVDWVSGACLLVRRAEAEAVGLLDERYFMYCEDVDFCAAIRARGGRVYFTPRTTITHVRGRSAAVDPGATQAAYRRSHLAFYQKHHPGWAPLLRLYLALQGKLPTQSADKKKSPKS